MSLLHKPDWDETRERYRARWNREYFGRCGLWVTAPRDDAPADQKLQEPVDPERKWTDLNYLFSDRDYWMRRTYFGGEAFPIMDYGYPGREGIGVFLGCSIRLMTDTGWVDPILDGEALEVRHLRIPEDNRWWRFVLDAHAKLAQRANEEGASCREESAYRYPGRSSTGRVGESVRPGTLHTDMVLDREGR